jgi:hypothetical protein
MGKRGRRRGRERTPADIAADALRTGRPRLGPDLRETNIVVRVSRKELAALKRRAAREGLTVTQFMRRRGGLE